MVKDDGKRRPEAKRRSLVDFMKAKRRDLCAVCRLPDDIRAELRTVRQKKISRTDVLAWLNDECKAKIAVADLDGHRNGHHDDR